MQVNTALAARIMVSEEAPAAAVGGPAKRKAGAPLPSLMEDDRFGAMFRDPSFAIDEAAEEYRVLHPNAGEATSSEFPRTPGNILQ